MLKKKIRGSKEKDGKKHEKLLYQKPTSQNGGNNSKEKKENNNIQRGKRKYENLKVQNTM